MDSFSHVFIIKKKGYIFIKIKAFAFRAAAIKGPAFFTYRAGNFSKGIFAVTAEPFIFMNIHKLSAGSAFIGIKPFYKFLHHKITL
jgi:hypothetical protein